MGIFYKHIKAIDDLLTKYIAAIDDLFISILSRIYYHTLASFREAAFGEKKGGGQKHIEVASQAPNPARKHQLVRNRVPQIESAIPSSASRRRRRQNSQADWTALAK
jgi:hypothetical protein